MCGRVMAARRSGTLAARAHDRQAARATSTERLGCPLHPPQAPPRPPCQRTGQADLVGLCGAHQPLHLLPRHSHSHGRQQARGAGRAGRLEHLHAPLGLLAHALQVCGGVRRARGGQWAAWRRCKRWVASQWSSRGEQHRRRGGACAGWRARGARARAPPAHPPTPEPQPTCVVKPYCSASSCATARCSLGIAGSRSLQRSARAGGGGGQDGLQNREGEGLHAAAVVSPRASPRCCRTLCWLVPPPALTSGPWRPPETLQTPSPASPPALAETARPAAGGQSRSRSCARGGGVGLVWGVGRAARGAGGWRGGGLRTQARPPAAQRREHLRPLQCRPLAWESGSTPKASASWALRPSS